MAAALAMTMPSSSSGDMSQWRALVHAMIVVGKPDSSPTMAVVTKAKKLDGLASAIGLPHTRQPLACTLALDESPALAKLLGESQLRDRASPSDWHDTRCNTPGFSSQTRSRRTFTDSATT
jgi:hypothetical protein